jgi:hypothetical protein
MNEQNSLCQQAGFANRSQHPPAKCQVNIICTGKDNKALDAAKEILISSFVKNMINKGKIDAI